MEILKKLKEQGWYLTEEGLKKITDAETPGTDVKKIIASALNWDFREIAGGALPIKREETLPGRIVLQVQKIRNIAAPKANEESKVAPRFLQIDFSDGQTLLQGLELEPIPALSLNVAPGTKVYLRAERLQLMQGFAVLKAADVQVLGGRVEQLAEKWELARTMMKYARSGRRISGSSGPPPWIAFGKKLEVKDSLDTRNFKSLQSTTDKDKDASKENEEFKAMRTEAIAEAAKAGSRKVFGGGNQQIIDHNVKKILEKGYNEEDAKQALRSTNNNLERALYNLKRRDDYKRNEDKFRNSVESAPPTGRFGRGGGTSREYGGKRGAASAKEEASAAKPAANVSLFDFLTEKLPANAEIANRTEAAPTTAATLASSSNNHMSNSKFEKSKSDVAKSSHTSKTPQDSNNSTSRPKFENNLSSSFAANRTPGAPRSGGRSEREPYNASERQTSSRYTSGSTRGGGSGRGGRGGGFQSGNRASYEEGNNRGGYQQRRETGGAAGAERNANSNNNNTSNNRNNRNSNERATVAATQSGNDKNQTQSQSAGTYENRRQPTDYQNKGHDKSRYNQKENSNNSTGNNRQYENNANRRENSYTAATNNNNNSSSKATAPAASNSNPNNNQNNSNNSEHAARMNKLVESTSKLKIDKTRDSGRNQQRQQNQRQQQQQQHQQQQQQQQYSAQQQQVQQMPAVQQYSAPASHQLHQQMLLNNQAQPNYGQQLPNGFSYDPSKIIGFQSKETNDFAMTLLKSQGLAAAAAPQQTPTTATHYMPPTAAPLQMPQQQQQPFAKPAAFVLPTVQSAAPPANASNYGMMQPAESWMWKIGDICLAKYWDDGRYYEAEITGVSDKTCVVFFRGYGNHEEVLQSDCLPITDANHRPINHYNNPNQQQQQQQQQLLAAALQQQQPPPPPPNMHLNNSAQSRAVPNRYRGERQVYVPPPKRDN